MAKAKTLKGSRVKQWDESKIRRGARGRFAEKPDAVGFTEAKARLPKGFKAKIRTSQELKEALKLSDAYKDRTSKVELLSQLTPKQKTRLREILERRRAKTPDSAPKKPTSKTPEANTSKASTTPKTPKKPVDPNKPSRASVQINFSDRIDIKVPEQDASYKVTENPNHRYTVKHDGKNVTLNTHTRTIEYDGEFTDGVPRLVGDPKTAKTEDLAKGLARAEKGALKGTAPTWDTALHGDLGVPDNLVGKSWARGENFGKPIMGMQVHHVDRWASDPARVIEDDFNAGRITERERIKRHTQQQELEIQDDGSHQYKLKIAPKGQRRFVILAGGVHQLDVPLYQANHPAFINKDTLEFDPKVGLPKKGEGGREWFNKYRNKFWKEYSKEELREISTELNNRVSKGEDLSAIKSAYEAEKTRLTSRVNPE